METIEMDEAVTQETVDAIKDAVPAWKLDEKSYYIGAAVVLASGILVQQVLKPVCKKAIDYFRNRKAAKKTKTGKPEEPPVVEVNLEEDLKIDDEEEES